MGPIILAIFAIILGAAIRGIGPSVGKPGSAGSARLEGQSPISPSRITRATRASIAAERGRWVAGIGISGGLMASSFLGWRSTGAGLVAADWR